MRLQCNPQSQLLSSNNTGGTSFCMAMEFRSWLAVGCCFAAPACSQMQACKQ
jgi:hypothetical protein